MTDRTPKARSRKPGKRLTAVKTALAATALGLTVGGWGILAHTNALADQPVDDTTTPIIAMVASSPMAATTSAPPTATTTAAPTTTATSQPQSAATSTATTQPTTTATTTTQPTATATTQPTSVPTATAQTTGAAAAPVARTRSSR